MLLVYLYVHLACFTFCLFLFHLVSEVGCGLWLWHSLDFLFNFWSFLGMAKWTGIFIQNTYPWDPLMTWRTVLVSLFGARQRDASNVFHKKSKVLLDGVNISYTINMVNNSYSVDAYLQQYFVCDKNDVFSVQKYCKLNKMWMFSSTIPVKCWCQSIFLRWLRKNEIGDQIKALDGPHTIWARSCENVS